jgi:hypothetical protein
VIDYYIEKIKQEPYVFPINTCIQKSIRLFRIAKRLGYKSSLILCLVKSPKPLRYIWPFNPHIYVIIDGKKIDYFYARWWNTDRKTYLDLKIRGDT